MTTYRVKFKLNGEWKTIELPWPGEDIYACLAAAKRYLRKLHGWTAFAAAVKLIQRRSRRRIYWFFTVKWRTPVT